MAKISLKGLCDQVKNISLDNKDEYDLIYLQIYGCLSKFEKLAGGYFPEHIFEDFITLQDAAYEVRQMAAERNLDTIQIFLNHADLTKKAFELDYYGNLKNITRKSLAILKKDVLNEMENQLDEL